MSDAKHVGAEMNDRHGTTGEWFFFNVSEHHGSTKSECGVYVGPKRLIFMECLSSGGSAGFGKADKIFERRLRDCLAGQT